LNSDYAYVYTVDWETWEKAGKPDIDGLDLDLHLDNYVRVNMLTAFLYKRFIPMNRVDWQERYAQFGVPKELGQDQWEFMIYSKGAVNEDDLRVKRCELND